METLITAISAILVALIGQFFMTKRQNNYLSKKFEKVQTNANTQLNDKIIIDELSVIKGQIVELKDEIKILNDLHKYSKYSKDLNNKIEEISDNILALKEFKQKEIIESLISGREKSLRVFSYIIDKEFDIDEIKVKEKILVYLKAVKLSINEVKLCLQEPNAYLSELEEILRIIVDNYIIELKDVKKLINGDRRKAFETISINMVKTIYTQTIDLYNQYRMSNERAA